MLAYLAPVTGQSHLVFRQLNTAHGLTDNYVRSMVTDKNGFVWVGTGEGLNRFNGREVQKFFKRDYPALKSDYISQLVCDSANEIWALTAMGHVTQIDRQRKLRHIGLYSHGHFIPTKSILLNAKGTIHLFTDSGAFTYRRAAPLSAAQDSITKDDFEWLALPPALTTTIPALAKWISLPNNTLAVYAKNQLYLLNGDQLRIHKKFETSGLTLLAPYSDTKLLVYQANATFALFNLQTGNIEPIAQNLRDQHGKPVSAPITNALKLNQDRWMLTSQGEGLYLWLEKEQRLINYKNNAADAGTIANNQLKELTLAPGGWLFAGGVPNGISYVDLNAPVFSKELFADGKGNAYNGFINSLTTRDGNTWYLTGSENLIAWNKNTDATSFLPLWNSKTKMPKRDLFAAAFDGAGKLWVATNGNGLYKVDVSTYKSQRIPGIADSAGIQLYGRINHMEHGHDGYMYISTRQGFYIFNENSGQPTKQYAAFTDTLKGKYCTRSYTDSLQNIWVATVKHGIYNYHIPTGNIATITTDNGLPSNNTFALHLLPNGTLLAGTDEGLAIIENRKVGKVLNRDSGLLNKRVEATLPDKSGRIWLGNDVGICCYNPYSGQVKAFDERYGLSVQGFRINSYGISPDGNLFWGTERGIQYFDPETLYNIPLKVRALVTGMQSQTQMATLTQSEQFKLPAQDDYVTFYFTSVEYTPRLQSFFRYKLEGLDTGWTEVFEQFNARYTLLPSGTYTFKLQVSHNGNNWTDADNTVTLVIGRHWYKHPVTIILFSIGITWLIVLGINMLRQRQAIKREELETEAIIHYFASIINTHQNIDQILWNVARNCISRLKFEDCVIYMLDDSRKVLVQKAAFGPKGNESHTIQNPIEIPLGKGIVGAAAQKGKAELVGNTLLDPRYIVDDKPRLSELAVPLIVDGKVIGVIDSEHSRKNFFTPTHLRIINTVAILCANQIQRAKAEQEKQNAIMEVLINKQQAAEYRLQSLRLQMNPHFLFNALNSIQQMILSNQELVATKYLSRFSKLLRAILIHSDKDTVSLQEELDIIKLYIELESVRFKASFTYKISVAHGMDTEEIRIPTLLVQPFVENAIWHGLMHKDGPKHLEVIFEESDDFLICKITDNGIGRKRAAEIAMTAGRNTHQSKGIQVSTERLKKMQSANGLPGAIAIIDLYNKNNMATGTQVIINIPV